MGSQSGESGDVSADGLVEGEDCMGEALQMASITVLQKGRQTAGSASARDGRRSGSGERGQGQGEEVKNIISSSL